MNDTVAAAPSCTIDDPNGIKDAAEAMTARAGSSAERLTAKLAASIAETVAATNGTDLFGNPPGDHVGDMIRRVLIREGGDAYTNDPSDAGGPTKYGITLGALADWRKRPTSAEDVQALTEAEAVDIYRRRYMPPGIEIVRDPTFQEFVFDFGVTSGPSAPIAGLQGIMKRIGFYDGAIDGDFGGQSRIALAKVQNIPALFYALKSERYELTQRYIGRHPENAKYAVGWSNRNDEFEIKFS